MPPGRHQYCSDSCYRIVPSESNCEIIFSSKNYFSLFFLVLVSLFAPPRPIMKQPNDSSSKRFEATMSSDKENNRENEVDVRNEEDTVVKVLNLFECASSFLRPDIYMSIPNPDSTEHNSLLKDGEISSRDDSIFKSQDSFSTLFEEWVTPYPDYVLRDLKLSMEKEQPEREKAGASSKNISKSFDENSHSEPGNNGDVNRVTSKDWDMVCDMLSSSENSKHDLYVSPLFPQQPPQSQLGQHPGNRQEEMIVMPFSVITSGSDSEASTNNLILSGQIPPHSCWNSLQFAQQQLGRSAPETSSTAQSPCAILAPIPNPTAAEAAVVLSQPPLKVTPRTPPSPPQFAKAPPQYDSAIPPPHQHKKCPSGRSASDVSSNVTPIGLGKTEKQSQPEKPRKKRKRKRIRKKILPDVKEYVDITENDVLLGRGGRSNHHCGNKLYRKVVSEFQVDYSNADNKKKTEISQDVVDTIMQEHKGHFLAQDDVGWYKVPNIVARRKASQALREDNNAEKRAIKRASYLQRKKDKDREATAKLAASDVTGDYEITKMNSDVEDEEDVEEEEEV